MTFSPSLPGVDFKFNPVEHCDSRQVSVMNDGIAGILFSPGRL